MRVTCEQRERERAVFLVATADSGHDAGDWDAALGILIATAAAEEHYNKTWLLLKGCLVQF